MTQVQVLFNEKGGQIVCLSFLPMSVISGNNYRTAPMNLLIFH